MQELESTHRTAPSLSADAIVRELRELILAGSIGVGVQLKQEALARRFGVSRIPVHEALKRLEAEGLVNLEFHSQLYGTCQRPTLLRMIADTVKGIDVHLRVLQSNSVGRKSSLDEHADILDACEARDIPRAIDLLEAHIEHTQIALRQMPRVATAFDF